MPGHLWTSSSNWVPAPAGPSYSLAARRLDVRYEVLEAEQAALPLAGGTVNGELSNYQVRCRCCLGLRHM